MRHSAYWSMEENAYRAMVTATLNRGKRIEDLQEKNAENRQPFMGTLASEGRKAPGLPMFVLDRVAVIALVGTIMKNPSVLDEMILGNVANTALLNAAVASASASSDIDAIMLLVDSPGGSVDGIAQLSDSVFAARKAKPVTAHVDGMCASAAYYVASQAQSITANRMDLVGSIGTRIMLYDYSAMYEMAGVKPVVVDTGEYKSAGAEGTVITDRQVADFQRIVDAYGADFLAGVTRGRRFSGEKMKSVADGRVWTAPEALGLGLIDGIATNGEALNKVRSTVKSAARASRARASVVVMGMGV